MCLSTLSVICLVLAYVEGSLRSRQCYDCMPFLNCREAKLVAETDKSETTRQLFRSAYCGMYNASIVKVCCSDFNNHNMIPDLDTRGNLFGLELEHPKKELLPDSCGIIAQDRIIGGVVATLYEFPWMVLISYQHSDSIRFDCSGTLINSRYVLTAAHCVKYMNIRGVRVGEYDIQQDIDCFGDICEKNHQDIEVENEIIHDDYNMRNYNNDIALLRLKNPVNLSLKSADTICLPTTAGMQTGSITNQNATVAGWGLTEYGRFSTVLRKVTIPVIPNNVCREHYSKISDSDPTQFCAGKRGKDSCHGDSGGPLMIETMINGHSRFVQYGIVSNGPNRCGSHAPGIYTDVRKYINWILDHIRE